MARMHKKSALADAAPLILGADLRGLDLLWERYERQLPLCGFTSNGLSCRKCFQGPCRINPFGDEPRRGICGADRDQIVMEQLFQATLAGVVDALRLGEGRELPDIGAGLAPAVRDRLTRAGLLPVRLADLFRVENSYFSHKGYLADSLRHLTRLGLLHFAALAGARGAAAGRFDPQAPSILVLGRPPAGLAAALEAELPRGAAGGANLLGRGPGLLPVPDHGAVDLLLGMGVDAVIVAPDAAWPAVETLAGEYGIPLFLVDGGALAGGGAAAVVAAASRHAEQRRAAGTAGPRPQEAQHIPAAGEGLREAIASGRATGVAVLLGEPTAAQSFFERTLALMEAALGHRAVVFLGGDLGAHAGLLSAELERRRPGALAGFAADLARDGLAPVHAFDSPGEIPQVVELLRGLPAVCALPEFFRPATWAAAVSLLAVGGTVQIGVRLPFWGSPALAGVLTSDWPALSGGRLLAAPALPAAADQAEELVAALKAGGGR